MENNNKWDLSALYASYDDPKYINDIKKFDDLLDKINLSGKELTHKDEVASLEKYLKLNEELNCLFEPLSQFSSLQTSTNVNDSKAQMELTKLFKKLEKTVSANVAYSKFIKSCNIEEDCKKSKFLNQYKWNLLNDKKDSKHRLSDKEELIISKYDLVAGSSWSDLQSKLTSNLKIKVPGFEKEMPLAEVRNLAYSNDPKIRKACYEAELKAYKEIDESVAMALNNIKRQANINVELRHYKSVLDMTCQNGHMKEKTLNALISAIKQELPKLRKYFKLKARAMGYMKGLPFYELFAPMGALTKTYTKEEAEQLVLDVYGSFSKPMQDSAKRAFDNHWIDVYPYAGKVGGAFCSYSPTLHEARVLTNFTGSLGDVQTLAHELGHAYHGYVMSYNPPLQWDHPMQLAETASTFAQILMTKKMLNDFTNPEDKLTLVEYSLEEDTQVVVDILCRFLFEKKVVDTPLEQPLSAQDMCQMMLDSQDESYGDGLDKDYKHPYMWLCKSHYYSAGLNFYNWPYAFGMLYARGLYAKYLENKEEFVKHYDEMLRNTCKMDVEDVALTMGIDLTKKEFWLTSLRQIEDDIKEFENLLKECKKIK
jgi:pepF/M3 family oligoendopeptidase